MANKQTRALAKRGLSLKFHRGVDFSHGNRDKGKNNEISIVERPSSKGRHVNSGAERKAAKRKSYSAPTKGSKR